MDEYCKRQAGLVPYSCSSYGGESDLYLRGEDDLYAVDFKKPVRKTTRNRETAMRKHGKVYNVTECPTKPMNKNKVSDVVCNAHRLPSKQLPKAIDEDLYKISPQLVRTTKRKKMLGFIFKCLCVS